MNLSDKNFHLERRIRQYEESKERLENEREDSKNEISKLEKECLMLRKTIERHVNKINLLQDELSQMNRNPSCDETQESDCCECWKDKNAISDFETIIIEQQIEIEKLNAAIDVLLERIVK